MKLSKLITGSSNDRLRFRIRLMQAFHRRGYHALSRFMSYRIQRRFSVYVAPSAVIPRNVSFPHPTGIVIGEGVVLGERVRVFQNVTLGGARIGDQSLGNYPVIGDGTTLFAGAVLVGGITIGCNCTIGANAVVRCDVPDDAVAVGIPARVLPPKTSPSGDLQ